MPMERPFNTSEWLATPEPVRQYVEALEQRIEKLEARDAQVHHRIEQIENRLKQNSQNSSKPPSSDPAYQHRSVSEENPSAAGVVRKAIRFIGNRCFRRPRPR
jgi:hypothetical protein